MTLMAVRKSVEGGNLKFGAAAGPNSAALSLMPVPLDGPIRTGRAGFSRAELFLAAQLRRT